MSDNKILTPNQNLEKETIPLSVSDYIVIMEKAFELTHITNKDREMDWGLLAKECDFEDEKVLKNKIDALLACLDDFMINTIKVFEKNLRFSLRIYFYKQMFKKLAVEYKDTIISFRKYPRDLLHKEPYYIFIGIPNKAVIHAIELELLGPA